MYEIQKYRKTKEAAERRTQMKELQELKESIIETRATESRTFQTKIETAAAASWK